MRADGELEFRSFDDDYRYNGPSRSYISSRTKRTKRAYWLQMVQATACSPPTGHRVGTLQLPWPMTTNPKPPVRSSAPRVAVWAGRLGGDHPLEMQQCSTGKVGHRPAAKATHTELQRVTAQTGSFGGGGSSVRAVMMTHPGVSLRSQTLKTMTASRTPGHCLLWVASIGRKTPKGLCSFNIHRGGWDI